jgi:probable HAF family extracellular repeat protein
MIRLLQERNSRLRIYLILSLLIFSTLFSYAQQPKLIWLGTIGGNGSVANAVSADGSVVIGTADDSNGNPRAFRWTAATGIQDLGTLGGDWSEATDISADGSIIVGWSYDGDSIYRAFKWTESDGTQDIGAGDWSKAYAISNDGSAVVIDIQPIAYRWTQTDGLEDLGTLGGSTSMASDISADGSYICGTSYDSSGNPYAFRWAKGVGMEQIGSYYSFPSGISGDGLTIAGDETGSAGFHKAFRWTQSGGLQLNIAGNFSTGYGVSGDGSFVVGSKGSDAFRFSDSGGLEILNDVYSDLLIDGSSMTVAFNISPNSQFIVGQGYNASTSKNEGFLLAISGITEVNELENFPSGFVLNQNYPNPFNPFTTISFSIPNEEFVTLKVFNSLGEVVADIVSETKPSGSYSVSFDASILTSGVYFYKISAGNFVSAKKMILVK